MYSSDPRVQVRAIRNNEKGSATGIGVTIVDADVATCLAYEFTKDSAEALAERKSKKIIEASVEHLNDHSHLYYSVRELDLQRFSKRSFYVKGVWEMCSSDGTAFLAYEDVERDFADDEGNTLASIQTAFMFEPLQSIGSYIQTKVTVVAKVDLKGSVPSSAVDYIVGKSTSGLSSLWRRFDKSFEIDALRRTEIAQKIRQAERVAEDDFLFRFQERKGRLKVKESAIGKPFIKVTGGSKGWGSISLFIIATIEEVAAFLLDFESRANTAATGDIERVVLKKRGDFQKTVRRMQILKCKNDTSEEFKFLNTMCLDVIDDNTVVILMEPEERRGSVSALEASVLARESITVRLTRRHERETKIEFITDIELGSSRRKGITKTWLMKRLQEISEMQQYFAYRIDVDFATERLGEVLGHDIVQGRYYSGTKVRNAKLERAKHVGEVIRRSKALNTVCARYPWMVILIQRVREGAVAANHPVHIKLNRIEEKEARVIGNNLMSALKGRKTAAAGVSQWIGQNDAMNELIEEYPWMNGLFEALGQDIVKAAPWGLRWRCVKNN